jgi:hypothetical protein
VHDADDVPGVRAHDELMDVARRHHRGGARDRTLRRNGQDERHHDVADERVCAHHEVQTASERASGPALAGVTLEDALSHEVGHRHEAHDRLCRPHDRGARDLMLEEEHR